MKTLSEMTASEYIVLWNSKEGMRRLYESKYCRSFFALAHLYERQLKPTYCGVASAVMVLNALRHEKQSLVLENAFDVTVPNKDRTLRHNYYNQLTFLDRKAQKVKSKASIEGKAQKALVSHAEFDPGLCLETLSQMLRLHMLEVEVVRTEIGSAKSLDRFRQDVMADGSALRSYLIANFDGDNFGRKGEGHFSPLAGYHPETDSCLVLDTNGCMQPWFWVSLEKFFESMCTVDGAQNRGYLRIYDCLDRR